MKAEYCVLTERPLRAIYLIVSIAVVLYCLALLGCNRRNMPSTAVPGNTTPDASASHTPDPTSTSEKSNLATENDSTLDELRKIGAKAKGAVLAKDTNALLTYESASARAEDEKLLRNTKGDLYCYIFDSSCITGSKVRSVYEILSNAHDLEIRASVSKSPQTRKLYGLLVFYDKSTISEGKLRSQKFRCSIDALRTVSSWHFEWTDGKWTTNTLFNYGTSGLC